MSPCCSTVDEIRRGATWMKRGLLTDLSSYPGTGSRASINLVCGVSMPTWKAQPDGSATVTTDAAVTMDPQVVVDNNHMVWQFRQLIASELRKLVVNNGYWTTTPIALRSMHEKVSDAVQNWLGNNERRANINHAEWLLEGKGTVPLCKQGVAAFLTRSWLYKAKASTTTVISREAYTAAGLKRAYVSWASLVAACGFSPYDVADVYKLIGNQGLPNFSDVKQLTSFVEQMFPSWFGDHGIGALYGLEALVCSILQSGWDWASSAFRNVPLKVPIEWELTPIDVGNGTQNLLPVDPARFSRWGYNHPNGIIDDRALIVSDNIPIRQYFHRNVTADFPITLSDTENDLVPNWATGSVVSESGEHKHAKVETRITYSHPTHELGSCIRRRVRTDANPNLDVFTLGSISGHSSGSVPFHTRFFLGAPINKGKYYQLPRYNAFEIVPVAGSEAQQFIWRETP